MKVEPVNGGCGAFVVDVDLNALSEAEVDAVATAQAEHGVVFFRDQELTPDGQLAAARRFGAINVNRFFTPVPEQPSVAMVLKEPQHETNVGGGWHTDHSYDDVPALGSLLYALEVPTRGGDTMFANMYSAYDALSPGLKRTLEGLQAVHSSRHVFGRAGYHAGRKDDRYHNPEAATQDAVHPMVIRHPPLRSSRALRQPGVHRAHRRLDGSRVAPLAGLPVPGRVTTGAHLPISLGGRQRGVLGQPGHLALRVERLSG